MTDKDIIKAFECCIANRKRSAITFCSCDDFCVNCPINGTPDCMAYLRGQALALINRQQAEIERLNDLLRRHQRHTNRIRMITAQTAKKIKAEAVKEFAEMLCEGRVSNDPVVIAVKAELETMSGDWIIC